MDTAGAVADTNAVIASLLRDLALVQTSTQSKWGYKRAAAAILNLEQPIEALGLPDGTLRKIPNIGPSSTRIILEVLQTGRSLTVEKAVAESRRAGEIEKSRQLRSNFLSRAQVLAILRRTAVSGPSLADYRDDLQMHSVWSDGADSLETIVLACIARSTRSTSGTPDNFACSRG